MVYLSTFLNQFEEKLESIATRFTKVRSWPMLLAGFCLATVLFFNYPDFGFINSDGDSTWAVVQKQIEDPTKQYFEDRPEHHNAKRTYRLTIPIFFKIIGVSNIHCIYLFQLFLFLLFFLHLIRYIKQIHISPLLQLVIPISFCFIYLGQVGVIDVYAKFDSIAVCLILLSMYYGNSYLILLFSFAAFFTDERSILSFFIVSLWWQLKGVDFNINRLRNFLIPQKQSLSIFISFIAYLAVRVYLSRLYGFRTNLSDVGLSTLSKQMNMILYGLWTAFEGFWLIIFIYLLKLILEKKYFFIMLLLTVVAPTVIGAYMVLDISRSLLYLFPLLFISIESIRNYLSASEQKRLFYLVALINILVPTYAAYGGFRIEHDNPFLIRLIGNLFT